MSTIEFTNNAVGPSAGMQQDWRRTTAYRCHVGLIKEDDGQFSAIVLNLPGTGSCGDTEEEALHNVREAVLGVINSYLESGEEVPWIDSVLETAAEDIPEGAKLTWILVNA